MILIIENFLEQIDITVTDELSHCWAVSTEKTTNVLSTPGVQTDAQKYVLFRSV